MIQTTRNEPLFVVVAVVTFIRKQINSIVLFKFLVSSI